MAYHMVKSKGAMYREEVVGNDSNSEERFEKKNDEEDEDEDEDS